MLYRAGLFQSRPAKSHAKTKKGLLKVRLLSRFNFWQSLHLRHERCLALVQSSKHNLLCNILYNCDDIITSAPYLNSFFLSQFTMHHQLNAQDQKFSKLILIFSIF